jgi:hypothetical protein
VVYKGEWKYGVRHGTGNLEGPSGYYSGEWQEGVRHGAGTEVTLATAAVYKGKWREGQRDGKGRLAFPGGTRYDRVYSNGALSSIEDPTDSGSLHRVTHLPNAPTFPPRFS